MGHYYLTNLLIMGCFFAGFGIFFWYFCLCAVTWLVKTARRRRRATVVLKIMILECCCLYALLKLLNSRWQKTIYRCNGTESIIYNFSFSKIKMIKYHPVSCWIISHKYSIFEFSCWIISFRKSWAWQFWIWASGHIIDEMGKNFFNIF